MTRWPFLLLLAISAQAQQNLQQVLAQGEKVFNQSCATGYCHALKGSSGGGAPRLAARSFDEAYINTTTARGISGTAMPAFGTVLSRPDLTAVVAYVATLNGIAAPNLNLGGGAPARPALPAEAEKGRVLFFDAVRGFGRCSTCHEVKGVGIPVAAPIASIPDSISALRALATPAVKTATTEGESMPALVVSQARARTIFFDLTSAPPVQRSVDSAAAKITDSSTWRHSSVLGAYEDGELESILTYLRAAVRP